MPPRKTYVVKAAELSLAAPRVIALRTARILAAGVDPAARDRRALSQMAWEKIAAWQESMHAMTAQVYKAQVQWNLGALRLWWAWCTSPWPLLAARPGYRIVHARWERSMARVIDKGIAPVHRRVTSNARRMSKRKR
jgi:hypothetical protein